MASARADVASGQAALVSRLDALLQKQQQAYAAQAAAAVAGANLALIPDTPAMFQRAGMLSPEGRCKTLDAAADGYARAEGVGVLLLQVRGPELLAAGLRAVAEAPAWTPG